MNRVVVFPIGVLMIALGVLLIMPAIMDIVSGSGDWQAFAISSIAAVSIGGLMLLSTFGWGFHLSRRDGYLLTIGCWLSLAIMAAVPFWVSDMHISFTDAVFESISGLTTTGSTVLTGLDTMPPGILLWRAMLQWIGGIGIIVMAVTLLPFLRVGGMQLYRMETSDQYDKFMPRLADICIRITIIYVALSILCAATYWELGMTGFEAIVHAMTTLSTGGFSTSDQSMGHFANPSIQWAAILFMLAGSLPFSVYIRFIHRFKFNVFLRDSQTSGFLLYTALAILGMTVFLAVNHPGGFLENLRQAAFNVVSVISTTGYASSDYLTWGAGAATLFFFLSMLGGCAGSTTGGLKAFRLFTMLKGSVRQGGKLMSPHCVQIIRMGDRQLSDDALSGVYLFFFVMMAVLGIITLGLTLTGLDFETSISAAVTAIANVGPGLGAIIGPAGNFEPLSDTAKWILDVAMLAGRLEFMTILVLFVPDFWNA